MRECRDVAVGFTERRQDGMLLIFLNISLSWGTDKADILFPWIFIVIKLH
jgi:hypothetical protein